MKKLALASCLMALLSSQAMAADKNAYSKHVFVANKERYAPSMGVTPHFIDAWGIAIRPKGAGGHFWVTSKDVSYEYVGDVRNSLDEKLRTLHKDKLETVTIPVGGDAQFATGTVFSGSEKDFVITQDVTGVQPITAPAKFLFSSDGGIISAWTERKLADGSFDRPPVALSVIDESKQGAQFFGLTLSHNFDRLYAANFGVAPGIRVFDGMFNPLAIVFDQPFDDNKNGQVDPGEYAPFNVQSIGEHIFVTYAKTQSCPSEEVAKNTCAKGALFAGEEDTSKPGQGRLAEFTEDGKLVTVWKDSGHLSAPWGMALAPVGFDTLSGKLLVGNFGDGSIAAFDPATHTFVDTMRDAKGKPVKIEKIWGLVFGNGESLGDADALYYAAGPEDEADGEFGSLRPVR